MFTKQKIAMVVAEFLGTAILALTVLAVSASNIGIGYFIAFAAGLAVLLLTLALGGVSGAVLNPAITLGLWSVRKLQTYQALVYIAAQMLGGLVAYALFMYMSGVDLSQKPVAKYDTAILVAEVVGTAIFAMGFAAASYQKLETSTKAFIIGAALTIGVIVAAANTAAGFLNPAVALGAHSLDLTNWGSLGNFVLGPILGAVIGFNLYSLLFAASAPPVVAPARPKPVPVAATKTTKKTVKKKK